MKNRLSIMPGVIAILLWLPTSVASADDRLQAVLDVQPPSVKERYRYRHPARTLNFFDVQPGMTVVEALPGRGWYSKILLGYLGENGHLIGADYPIDLLRNFSFYTEEMLLNKQTWPEDWPRDARSWGVEDAAHISAFQFGSVPAKLHGTVDRVLFIRALHNLNRFDRSFLVNAIGESYELLKPGGIVGVVQHQAPEQSSDEWANGSRGYLKKSFVIEQMQLAGFELLAESSVNHNKRDQPGLGDVVWRLPPSLRGSDNDPQLRASMIEIGESNRMTLIFIKPE